MEADEAPTGIWREDEADVFLPLPDEEEDSLELFPPDEVGDPPLDPPPVVDEDEEVVFLWWIAAGCSSEKITTFDLFNRPKKIHDAFFSLISNTFRKTRLEIRYRFSIKYFLRSSRLRSSSWWIPHEI